MKKIVVSGYYGFNNAGDEAVLYSIVKTIKGLRSDVELTVLSNDPAGTMADHGVKAVNRWKLTEIWHALKQADLLISGGGSLLQDVTGSRSVLYYLAIVRFAKFLGKPVIFYANGVGPVTKPINKFLIAQVANSVDTITVRDAQSLADLQEMGVDRPLSRVTADPALGIDDTEVNRELGSELLLAAGVSLEKPILGIAVRSWQGIENYPKVIARVADILVERGWQVVMIPMHYPQDIKASVYITREMNHKAAILDHKLSVEQLLSVIGQMNMLIGMRLHALIIAAVMKIPFVGISYDPKVDRFLEITEQANAGHAEVVSIESLLAAVERTINHQEEITQELSIRMTELRERARESAVLALSLLKTPLGKK